jgi:hypothetical protein
VLLDVFGNPPRSQSVRSFDFQQFIDFQREAVHRQEFLTVESDKDLADAHLESNQFADESPSLGLGLCALGHFGLLTAMLDSAGFGVNRGLSV